MKARRFFGAAFTMFGLLAQSPFAGADQESKTKLEAVARVSEFVEISAAAQATNALEKAGIEAVITGYFEALNHSDVDAAMKMYTSSPVQLPFLEPSVVGAKAVRKAYETLFQSTQFHVHTMIQELVQMSPEWAYVRNDSEGAITPTKTGKAVHATFHEFFLVQKTSDGRWHLARYCFSPASPPPAGN